MVDYRRFKRFFAKRWQYIIVVILGVILSVGVWGKIDQVLTGDDYAFHVSRLMSSSKAWSNGQIVPQVDPDALGGFGYAYNIFYGPLVTYAAALMQVVINSWPITISLILVLCVILAGILMCRTMMRISNNSALATIVAAIYMASPYFLNNLYSRMALGEVVAFVAVPILILGLFRLTKHEQWAARDIAVAAALLILSHSLSALLFALMAGLYIIFNLKKLVDWDNLWRMFLGVVVAVGLTAFFTLPLIEAKMTELYGVFDQGYSEVYFGANPQSVNDHRLHPDELMVSDYTADSEKSLALGVMVWIGLLGFWFVRKRIENKDKRRLVTSFWAISVLAILMTLPIINWYYMPGVMWQIQFPWRFLMITAAAMSLVSGYTIYSLLAGLAEEKQRVLAVIVGLVAVSLVAPAIVVKPEQHLADITDVSEDAVNVGWEAEYAPMQLLCSPDVEEDVAQGYACSLTRVRELLEERGTKVKVVDGKAKVSQVERDGLKVNFLVTNETEEEPVTIELPMVYYPGYEAEMNDNILPVRASDEYGLAQIVIPAGESGEVKVWYGMSKATRIGLMVSGATAGLGVIWLIISRLKDMRSHKKDAEMETLMDSVREVVDQEKIEEEVEEIDVDEDDEEEAKEDGKTEAVEKVGEPANKPLVKISAKSTTAPTVEKPRITKVKAKSTPKKEKEV